MARGGAINLVGMLVGGLLGFLVIVVVTRGLHTARAGVFLEAVALFSILSGAVEFGADDGLTRMISRHRAVGRSQDVFGTIVAAVTPVFALGLVASISVIVLAPQISSLLVHGRGVDSHALVPYARVLGAFLPVSAVSTAMLAGTRGFGRMLPNAVIANLVRPGTRLLLVSMAVVAGAGSVGIAIAWALPIALTFVVVSVILVRLAERQGTADRDGPRPVRDLAAEFWRFAAPRGLSSTFGITVAWLDTLLIGGLLTSDRAGIYAAAGRLLTLGFFALGPVQLVLAPLMSGLLAGGETERAAAAYRTATVWAMVPSWPIYLTLAAFAPFLLRVFGPGFDAGQDALLILAAAGLFAMTTGPALTVLLMGGKSGWILAVSATSLTLNVVLNLVLIPRLGISGAAIAWAATIALNNLAGLALARSLLRLSPLGPGVAAVALGAGACFGGVGLTIRLAMGPTLPAFVLFAVMATIAYAAFLWKARDLLSLSALRSALRSRMRRERAVARSSR
jgi:O-antigen/teichoic acid export membrane protein